MALRGLVVTPRFTWDGAALHFPRRVDLDALDLRRYLLYWDRIDFPDNNLIGSASSPDVEFLNNAGVLTRTRVQVSGSGNIGLGYVLAQFAAFQQLNQREPGQWSLGQTATSWYIPTEARAFETRAVEIELYAALPVPSDAVALADILEFRERRRAERLALRAAMDDLYSQIQKDRDIPRAKTAALDHIERSLMELDRVVSETWTSRLRTSAKVELNVRDLAVSAVAGAKFATTLGLPPAVGALAAAAAASIRVDVRQLWAPRLPESLSDFAYVYLQRELT